MKGNDKDVSMNIGFSSDMILGGLRKNSDSKPEASPMKTLRSWLQSLEKANFDIKSLEFACHSVTPSVAKGGKWPINPLPILRSLDQPGPNRGPSACKLVRIC